MASELLLVSLLLLLQPYVLVSLQSNNMFSSSLLISTSTNKIFATLITPSQASSCLPSSTVVQHSTGNSAKQTQILILYISVSVAASSILFAVFFVLCFCRAEKKRKNMRITDPSVSKGELCLLPLGELPSTPPNRDIWVVASNRLKLGKKLGEGAFGYVFKAILTTGEDSLETKVVAVKMAKEDASSNDREDLLAELRIMKKLKPHPNVVSLIGAVLNEANCPLVIVEFVPFGDLLGYLRKMRGVKDSCYFDVDHLPLKELCTSRELMRFAIESAQGMEYLSMKKVRSVVRNMHGSPRRKPRTYGYAWSGTVKPGWRYNFVSRVHGSLQCPFMDCLTDILCSIVHRDLAARNVLVGLGKTCKITDFGMARDVRRDEIYIRSTRGLIPVKWTAIESILRGIYTTRSDVWSFGVLLFEIFTVGGFPYPGMDGYEVRDFISQGNRIPKPMHVDNELYQVMMNCWHSNPRKRPAFKQLVCTLKRLELCHQEYINLSEYSSSNYENIEKLQQDDRGE